MEQKVVEKMQLALNCLEEKAKKFNDDSRRFRKEVFTDDICEMINTLRREDGWRDYMYKLNKEANLPGSYICFDAYGKYYLTGQGIINFHEFNIEQLKGISRSGEGIEKLKKYAHELETKINSFQYLQDNIEDIITNITTRYKKLTETQSDEMDEILKMIGADYKPTRHIKVTVEWI